MTKLAVAVAAIGLVAGSAMATWSDDFDSYSLGSINGQGGWVGWDNNPAFAGTVTAEMSRSPSQSQLIEFSHDSVHQFSGYNSGMWEFTAWQYIPGNMIGSSYFIMLNTYVPNNAAANRWSVQLDFDSATKTLIGDCGGADNVVMPYVSDQWAEITVKAYLDPADDWCQVFYNGALLDDAALPNHPVLGGGYQWSAGVFGNDPDGARDIACVDLFANNATKVYYDDLSLVPEPATCLLLLGALGLIRRR